MHGCPKQIENLLDALEKCAIKEADLWFEEENPATTKKFLKSQEKNLRKLKISTDFDLPGDVMNLKLESLDYANIKRRNVNVSLELLKHQVDLKTLKLCLVEYSNEHFSMICELKNLEHLHLSPGKSRGSSGLNNLHKLQRLKSLLIPSTISPNVLDYLQFGVFNDLEELQVDSLRGASVAALREMKRITPKLKKIRVSSGLSANHINAMLESLESLETMYVNGRTIKFDGK
jgi:hypothetical protein